MALPALGMLKLRQVGCGVKTGFFFLLLVSALLPVLIPDSVYGFRIRDVSTASSEQTRSSCNPLLGKCTDQKISGVSSATVRIRRRFEGPGNVQSRTSKIQPLVEESDEVESERDRSSAGDSSYLKSKSNNARLQFRSFTLPKTNIGQSGRSIVKLKANLASSDEEADGNYEDDEDEVDDDDKDDDDDDDDDSDDNEKNSEDDEDKDDESPELDEAETDDVDEEKDNDETSEFEDDGDNDEEEESEQEQIELKQYNDSDEEDVKSVESAENSSEKIEFEDKLAKQDVIRDKKNVKSNVSSRDVRSIERDVEKSIEHFQEATKVEISDDGKKDIKTTREDDNVGRKIATDAVKMDEEKVVEIKIKIESTNEKSSNINESNDDESDDDDNGEDKIETKEEVTVPLKKLEKVRLADKSKSMEILRTRSLEILLEKLESEEIEKDVSETIKIESPKRTPHTTQKPEIKPSPKIVEKIPVPQEIKKAETGEKKKTASNSKKEAKSVPKRSTKPEVKISETKPNQKSEKSKSRANNRAEASITLPELNDLLLHVPSFTPNFTAIKDPLCQQHGKIFLRQLRGYKLWALQMLDSSAKIPSGLIRGNINQLGDFDQCLGVKAHVKVDKKTVKVQGKYCLATLDFQATRNDMKIAVNMMQSRAFIRANMNEPAHFVPRFTTANWALCVPATCSATDVQSVIEDALSIYNVSMGLKFTVGINSDSCYVKQKSQPYSKETVAVLYFYAITVCLVFVATLRDFCVTSEGPGSYSERMIMAFSLRRTTTAFLQDSQHNGDIRCIHGIRSIATIFLYMAHKLIPIASVPLSNRISLTEVANNPLSSILRVSLVYTDSFLLMSGVLTAYNMAKEFNDRGEIRWFCRFVTRFIRLTPALLAVVFWYAFIMEHIGSGPQWNTVVKSNAELCKQNAWTNLLYIQNFFPFEEMCATHTHQLALDMQLSLLAPMLVFFLYIKPVIGILVVIFILQVSATLRYLATMNNYLSVVIFHGMTLKHLYKTANLTYALPLHRATPYLFGVALGVLMRYTGRKFRIPKVLVIIGWLLAVASGSWSLLSPWKLSRRDYTYDVEEASYYAVISPVCWAASLCWIIFASFTEHGGLVNKFLSNYWFLLFSRLSYSIYLTQFAVFFYNVGTTRYASEFQLHRSVDLYEVATVVSISIGLTLLLDLPMQEVKNVIMECTDGLLIEVVSNEEKNNEVTNENENRVTEAPADEEKLNLYEEVESSDFDWRRDAASSRKIESGYFDGEREPSGSWTYRKDEGRRKPFVKYDANDEEIPTWDWIKTPVRKISRINNDEDRDLTTERRSQSRQGIPINVYIDEPRNHKRPSSAQQIRDEDIGGRDQRSQSRRSLAKDPEELSWDSRTRDDSLSRSVAKDFDVGAKEFTARERSLAKESDTSVTAVRREDEQQPWQYVKRERSASQSGRDGTKSSFESLDVQPAALRLSTRSLPRVSELRKRVSSGSEEEINRKEMPKTGKTIQIEEPRVCSDEENWEHELTLRRQKIADNLPSQEKRSTMSEEEEWNILKRRSSAEGKMALLNDSPEIEHFGAWSISKVPNPGSFSHGQSESDEENAYIVSRNNYRETRPPFRESYDTQSEEEMSWNPSRQQSYTSGSQPTSVDEEENRPAYDFVLKKESKRTSLQNLSKISQKEPEADDDSGWDFVKEENTDSNNQQTTSTGLFKRASIIRSQASEEDPEYLIPERPKLVEQEQEHPFKKAWQMQKSRSEEDGPAGYNMAKEKDSKQRPAGTDGQKDVPRQEESKRKPPPGGQNEDLSYFGGDEAESTSLSYPASNSGDSENLDWIEDDEPRSGASGPEETELESTESADNEKDAVQYGKEKKEQGQHSEESNWEWNQEET